MPKATDKPGLRKQQRQRRRALSSAFRARAARALVRQFARWRCLRRARQVAVYLAAGSEMDTGPLIACLLACGVHLYAPRIARGQALRFVRLHRSSAMRTHAQYGMRQPVVARTRPLARMDLVLIPLLAYDAAGNRLGQGGGYYDRALARAGAFRPLRIGLAYAAQALAAVPVQAFDAPLHGVLTERGLQRARQSR